MPQKTISVGELSTSDFEREGLFYPRKIYALLLTYQKHPLPKLEEILVRVYLTDFTATNTLYPTRVYFDDCILRNGNHIEKDKILTVEMYKREFERFTKQLYPSIKLASPELNPSENVFKEQIIIEIDGQVKRYREYLDFQKATLKLLDKKDLAEKIRQNDTHLIDFLKRLQMNSPKTWDLDLEVKYGLNELLESSGIDGNDHQILASQFTDTRYMSPANSKKQKREPHIRLLSEKPPETAETYSQYTDAVLDLGNKILKREDSVSMSSYSDLTQTLTDQLSGGITDNREITPSQGLNSSPLKSQISCNYLKIIGYLPNKDDSFIIRNYRTNKIEVNDTFEIFVTSYQQNKDDKPFYKTIRFANAESIMNFFNIQNKLMLEDESELRQIMNRIINKPIIFDEFNYEEVFKKDSVEPLILGSTTINDLIL